ncbi:MAG: hypothetical protein DVB22_003257 [Verrucomicrobia bacterium]|nr:MAG: hypothetical protein DVB22_003257 [Verrucomicrobiota bacterium]
MIDLNPQYPNQLDSQRHQTALPIINEALRAVSDKCLPVRRTIRMFTGWVQRGDARQTRRRGQQVASSDRFTGIKTLLTTWLHLTVAGKGSAKTRELRAPQARRPETREPGAYDMARSQQAINGPRSARSPERAQDPSGQSHPPIRHIRPIRPHPPTPTPPPFRVAPTSPP